MGIEKLERVMWRLRSRNKGQDLVTVLELRRAIMYEIGTDRRTYQVNKKALVDLGWIRSKGNKWIRLTGNDLTGDDL